jgi:hypothetical protein
MGLQRVADQVCMCVSVGVGGVCLSGVCASMTVCLSDVCRCGCVTVCDCTYMPFYCTALYAILISNIQYSVMIYPFT